MREGVCFLWTPWLYTVPACLAHILSWLWRRAVMHVWSQAKTDTQKSHTLGTRKAIHFLQQRVMFLPYENVDPMPFLHSHGIFANDQTHLQKQAGNRRAPPQHLLSPPFQGLPGDLKDEIPSSFPPILPTIYLKGALKGQVVLVTSVEKFSNDTQTLLYLYHVSQRTYVIVWVRSV